MKPRRSLRLQLTLLYAIPFALSGAVLLGILSLQVNNTAPVGSGVRPPGPDPARNQLLGVLGIALVATLVVAVVVGWVVSGRFLKPLRDITSTARDISATNLHRRLGRTGRNDELTVLAGTLDDLFARLEAAFEAQRRFVANASHELRTPLTAERTLLQVALADPSANVDGLRATCREVLALGRTQERLIDALLTLASSEQGLDQREAFDLAALTSGVLRTRADAGIRVVAALDPAPTTGDPRLVESLVANLVDNALRYNVPGGRVEVATASRAGRARLAVRNTGPVVPPDQVERLFEPFQRLGRQRVGAADGHGLGLAIVKAIATAHGATVTVNAVAEGGLAIEVDFPEGGIKAA